MISNRFLVKTIAIRYTIKILKFKKKIFRHDIKFSNTSMQVISHEAIELYLKC